MPIMRGKKHKLINFSLALKIVLSFKAANVNIKMITKHRIKGIRDMLLLSVIGYSSKFTLFC